MDFFFEKMFLLLMIVGVPYAAYKSTKVQREYEVCHDLHRSQYNTCILKDGKNCSEKYDIVFNMCMNGEGK